MVAAVLGVGIAYAVLRPGIIRHAAQMQAVRADGLYSAFALLAGAFAAHWFWKKRHAFAVVLTMAASVSVLLLALAHAQDEIARPGTRDLALVVQSRAQPADRIYHYHEFFHDFTFYAQRTVGTIGDAGELELAIDPAARASGRFIDDAEFRRQWSGSTRLWIVARQDDVTALFADPSFHYHLLGESRSHYLFSNQP